MTKTFVNFMQKKTWKL